MPQMLMSFIFLELLLVWYGLLTQIHHPFDVQLEIWIWFPTQTSGIQISISKCVFENISTDEFHWHLILKVSRDELIMFLQTDLLFL